MESSYVYSVVTGVSKRLIAGVVKVRDKREAYYFIGQKGIVLAIIPKELSPLILIEEKC